LKKIVFAAAWVCFLLAVQPALAQPKKAVTEGQIARATLYETIEDAQNDDLPLRLTLAELLLEKVPAKLAELTTLRWLDLGQNKLKEVPKEVLMLKQLHYLRLDENAAIAALPDSLVVLVNLTELHLANMQSLDWNQAAQVVAKMPALTTLNLQRNGFRYFPQAFGSCKNITDLDLSGNQLTKADPILMRLMGLQAINLRQNGLVDVPTYLATLPNLESLDLRNNQITAVPDELLKAPKLTLLMLEGNPLPEEEWRRIQTINPHLLITGIPQ